MSTAIIDPTKVEAPSVVEAEVSRNEIALLRMEVTYEEIPTSRVSVQDRRRLIEELQKSQLPVIRAAALKAKSGLASAKSLAEEWDRPEEDEACRRSRPGT